MEVFPSQKVQFPFGDMIPALWTEVNQKLQITLMVETTFHSTVQIKETNKRGHPLFLVLS